MLEAVVALGRRPSLDDEVPLTGGGRSLVTRQGDRVLRPAAPWSRTTIALLRYLEEVGFEHAPRVVESGLSPDGREVVTFVKGDFVHPGPWDDDALPQLGRMLARLHEATRSFVPPPDAIWRPWFGRALGAATAIGHCDAGPWNVVCHDRRPFALIDWEQAGPVDPLVELAQACWLNAQFHDDDIAEREGLPSAEARGRWAGLLLDGYSLPRSRRSGFMDAIRDFAILSAANEAIEARVTPESEDASPLWAISWRARSAGWIVRHHATLERALVGAG